MELNGCRGLTGVSRLCSYRAGWNSRARARTRLFSGFQRFLDRKGVTLPVGNKEHHHTDRIGWLRAAVLGANDGILSTSSLVLGVAAAHATHRNLLIAGMAGLVAGAMSMAAGEYVSVHSQADTERADLNIERAEIKTDNKGEHKELARADLNIERAEIKTDNKGEHKELAEIYIARGLDPSLAKQVAQQLMVHDALGAHASDELGISRSLRPRPIQAALSSAASFALGALAPLLVTAITSGKGLILLVSVSSLALLALLG